ncbi:MAG TPA: VCBS repeat-containing protein [Polyangiaceae bacterium]|jgi:hypothetical protein
MKTGTVRHAVALSLLVVVAACSSASPSVEGAAEPTRDAFTIGTIGKILLPPPANAHSFQPPAAWGSSMSSTSWTSTTPRMLADVDGDGRSDIVGFNYYGAYVGLSTGTGFPTETLYSTQFGANQGWDVTEHIRTTADLNNDGRADLIGFGYAGVWTQLSVGGGFAPSRFVLSAFGYGAGWSVTNHIRTLADVNGDKYLDIVGFNDSGIYVAIGDKTGGFGPAVLASSQLVLNNGGWTTADHVRTLADVNNDGCTDVVGFGYAGVWTELSSWCSGGSGFQAPTFVLQDFGYEQGWRDATDIRVLADMNHDAIPDIVGFADDTLLISYGTGANAFGAKKVVINFFGVDEGWSLGANPRFVVDLNHDGYLDVVGYATNAVYRMLNGPNGFGTPEALIFDPKTTGDQRLLGDVDGDGNTDLLDIGAGQDTVALSSTTAPAACPAAAGQCSSLSGATDMRLYDTLVAAGASCSAPATFCTGAASPYVSAMFYTVCTDDAKLRAIPTLSSDTITDALPVIADTFAASGKPSACLPQVAANQRYVFWAATNFPNPSHQQMPRCPTACFCPPDLCADSGGSQM